MPDGNWRSTLAAGTEDRKPILVKAFSDNLRKIGNYDFIAETSVLRPVKDRTLYCLF